MVSPLFGFCLQGRPWISVARSISPYNRTINKIKTTIKASDNNCQRCAQRSRYETTAKGGCDTVYTHRQVVSESFMAIEYGRQVLGSGT